MQILTLQLCGTWESAFLRGSQCMQCVFVGKEKEEGGLLRKFTGKEISSHILFEHKNKEVPFKQRLPCLFHWGGGGGPHWQCAFEEVSHASGLTLFPGSPDGRDFQWKESSLYINKILPKSSCGKNQKLESISTATTWEVILFFP